MSKKPHKFEWNGVDVDTVLSASDLLAICAQAAVESTGDLWNGKQRIDEDNRGDGWVHYVIKSGLGHWFEMMTFLVEIGTKNGRTTLETTMGTYTTTQQKIFIFIPLGPKKMVAHHTYMQFAHKVANTVQGADRSAVIRIREGIEGYGPAPIQRVPAAAPIPSIVQPVAASSVAEPALAPPPPPPVPDLTPPPPPPPVVSVPVPAAESVPREVEPASGTLVDDATRRVPRRPRANRNWELELPDERVVSVEHPVVFGRDPIGDGYDDAQLVPVPDDALLVSKTHAVFEMVNGRLTVTDLHSSNGTVLTTTSGAETDCEPNVPVALRTGSTVELGNYLIKARQIEVDSE